MGTTTQTHRRSLEVTVKISEGEIRKLRHSFPKLWAGGRTMEWRRNASKFSSNEANISVPNSMQIKKTFSPLSEKHLPTRSAFVEWENGLLYKVL